MIKKLRGLWVGIFAIIASVVLAEDIAYSDGATISDAVVFKPAAGETATFTATGTVTMPSSATRSTDWPFAFYDTNGNVVWGYNAASDQTMAVGAFTNATARFTSAADGTTSIDFDSGAFDFASLNDTATAGYMDFLRPPTTGDQVVSPLASSTLAVHSGASVRFPAFNYIGHTAADGAALLDVDGGRLDVAGQFLVCPLQTGISQVRSNTVRVRNGGTLALTKATDLNSWSWSSPMAKIGYGWVSKTDFLVDVTGEGTLWDSSATWLLMGYRLNNSRIHVSDGATMRLGGFCAPCDNVTSPRIVVDSGATLESTGAVHLGTVGNGSSYDETETILAATNATVNLAELRLGTNSSLIAKNTDLTIGYLQLQETSNGLFLDNTPLNITDKWRIDGRNHPEWMFENLDATVGQFNFGFDASNPTVTFKNSRIHMTNSISLGHYRGDTRLVIDGDTLMTWETNKSWWSGFSIGTSDAAGTGRVDLVSGEFRLPNDKNTFFINVGAGKNCYGELNVEEGGRIISDRVNADGRRDGNWSGIRFGNNAQANGVMNVNGGKVYVPLIELSHDTSADATKGGVLNISGGLVDCWWIRVATDANWRGTVNLTGGDVAVVRLLGGSGSSTFYANGGTLRTADDLATKSAEDQWIKDLSSATVGEKGLTLDVRYPVPVSQTFSDAADATGKGLIVKTGEATLTQSGVLNNSVTEVAEGQMNYSAATAGTCFKVTNGAMLAFTGSSDVSIGGLTLGDEETTGAVMFKLGQTVTSATEPVLTDAVVTISGTQSVGSYTVLKQSGEATEATCAAWQNLTLGGGNASGYTYTFGTTTTDSVTSFTITIAESAALGDDDYVTPEGVTGVKLWSGETLASGGYRLTNGTYAKIEATATATLAADVQLPGWIEVNVPADQTLTLSGRLSGGGIRKTGDGELIVSGANNYLGLGFQLEGGTLRYTDGGAFGLVTGITPTLKVTAGTIDFGTAKGTTTGALTLANDSSTTVILQNSGNLTFSDYALGSGPTVKLGPGRIELVAASDKETASPVAALTVADGDLVFNQTGRNVGINRTIYIGSDDYTCEAEPCLSVIGGQFSMGSKGSDSYPDNTYCYLYLGKDPVKPAAEGLYSSPGLVCSNVTIVVNRLSVGEAPWNGTWRDVSPRITFFNTGYYAWQITSFSSRASDKTGLTTLRAKDSRFCVGEAGFQIGYRIDAEFDNCVVGMAGNYWTARLNAGQNTIGCGKMGLGRAAAGTVAFKNGSQLRCALPTNLEDRTPGTLNLTFDASSCWDQATGSWDSTAQVWNWSTTEQRFLLGNTAYRNLVTGEDGYLIAPRANTTHVFEQAIFGEAGFVKRGEGTVNFLTAKDINWAGTVTNAAENAATIRTTGWNAVEEGLVTVAAGAAEVGTKIRVAEGGTLDLQNATHTLTLSGDGVVQNGTLSNASVLTYEPNAALTFSNCKIGRVTIDVGDLAVTKMTKGLVLGTAGSGVTFPSTCRLTGTAVGKDLVGNLCLSAEKILLDISTKNGILFIVR